MIQRTSVGLDVHARSVVACGIDGETGEIHRRRLTPDHDEILARVLVGLGQSGLRGWSDRVRAGEVPACGGNRVCGRGAVEVAASGGGSATGTTVGPSHRAAFCGTTEIDWYARDVRHPGRRLRAFDAYGEVVDVRAELDVHSPR